MLRTAEDVRESPNVSVTPTNAALAAGSYPSTVSASADAATLRMSKASQVRYDQPYVNASAAKRVPCCCYCSI